MKVISILNTKGGVGKTTIATNLAVMFARDKYKVLLIDSDHQGSSTDFRAIRAEKEGVVQFSASQILTPTLHKDLKNFNFDFIIVDIGGRDNKVFRSGIMASDYAIVPMCPSQYDFWGSQNTFDVLQEAKLSKPDLKIFSILNMVIPGTKIAKEIKTLIDDFKKEYEIEFFKNYLVSRVAYKYSVTEGLGVVELPNNDAKATGEMKNIYDELKKEISL